MLQRSDMRIRISSGVRGQLSVASKNLQAKSMKTKLFFWLLAIVFLAASSTAQAQQPKKVPRIGFLSARDSTTESARAEAIRLALRERGYIEGQNIATEYRYAEGKLDRLPELAAELVRFKVDIIVAGGDPGIRAAKNATKTIPIVTMGRGAVPSRPASLKALLVPAATSPALQTLAEN